MILNSIQNGYIGNQEISRIYLGNNLIFPAFSVTTVPAGTIEINWGDESVNTINSGQTINKTYTF